MSLNIPTTPLHSDEGLDSDLENAKLLALAPEYKVDTTPAPSRKKRRCRRRRRKRSSKNKSPTNNSHKQCETKPVENNVNEDELNKKHDDDNKEEEGEEKENKEHKQENKEMMNVVEAASNKDDKDDKDNKDDKDDKKEAALDVDALHFEVFDDVFSEFYLSNTQSPRFTAVGNSNHFDTKTDVKSTELLLSGYLHREVRFPLDIQTFCHIQQIVTLYYKSSSNDDCMNNGLLVTRDGDQRMGFQQQMDLDRELGLFPDFTLCEINLDRSIGDSEEESIYHSYCSPQYSQYSSSACASYCSYSPSGTMPQSPATLGHSPYPYSNNNYRYNSNNNNNNGPYNYNYNNYSNYNNYNNYNNYSPAPYSPHSPVPYNNNNNYNHSPAPYNNTNNNNNYYHRNRGQNSRFQFPKTQNYENYENYDNNDNKKGTPYNFNRMSMESILEKNFGIIELLKYDLLVRCMKDQIGSRYLQRLLKETAEDESLNLMSKICYHLITEKQCNLTLMAEDIYGNYLIQLLFLRGNDVHHNLLLNNFVYSSMLRLCKSKYGCRVIQQIFNCCKNLEQLTKLTASLETQCKEQRDIQDPNKRFTLNDCLQCCNVNRVLQVILEINLPYKCIKFIGEQLERNLVHYSEHTNACRVVQSFIKMYGDKLNVSKLLLNKSHLYLSEKIHGNYVIQCIITRDAWYSKQELFKQFRHKLIYDIFEEGNIEFFSKNKYGSNVIETCIRCSNKKQIDYLVTVLCRRQGHLLQKLMQDKFGNYVPKTLLENCYTQKQRNMIVNTIHRYITNLYSTNHYGFKHCFELIMKSKHIKYAIEHNNYYQKKQ